MSGRAGQEEEDKNYGHEWVEGAVRCRLLSRTTGVELMTFEDANWQLDWVGKNLLVLNCIDCWHPARLLMSQTTNWTINWYQPTNTYRLQSTHDNGRPVVVDRLPPCKAPIVAFFPYKVEQFSAPNNGKKAVSINKTKAFSSLAHTNSHTQQWQRWKWGKCKSNRVLLTYNFSVLLLSSHRFTFFLLFTGKF